MGLIKSDYPDVPNAVRIDPVTMAKSTYQTGNARHTLRYHGEKLKQVSQTDIWYANEAKQLLDELVYKTIRSIEKDQDSERMFGDKLRKPRPSELYREHADILRLAVSLDMTFSWRAKDLLANWQLDSTIPYNDLINNPAVDPYTGLLDIEQLDIQYILPERHEIIGDPLLFMFEKANELEAWDKSREPMIEMVAPPTTWNRYLEERQPYSDPKMNELFYQANIEGIGTLDDPLDEIEDVYDELIPTHMEISQELNLSYDAREAIFEIKRLIREAAEKVDVAKSSHDLNDKGFWREFWRSLKSTLFADVKASMRKYFKGLEDYEMAALILTAEGRFGLPSVEQSVEHENPDMANLWVPVRIAFTYLFDRETIWKEALKLGNNLMDRDKFLAACSKALDLEKDPTKGLDLSKRSKQVYTKISKMIWRSVARIQEIDNIIVNFGDEIADMLNESGSLGIISTTKETIESLADQWLEESINTSPEYHPQRTLSRAFQVGFIDGVMNGLPITNASYTCVDNGHDHWRQSISFTGYVAYRRAIADGKDQRSAMSAFWKAARNAGDVKDKILTVEPDGLIVRAKTSDIEQVAEPRKINYGLAAFIINELDLTKQSADKLLQILRSKNWGLNLQKKLT